MLICMEYCGGCGCEMNMGDGVGILMGFFYDFFELVVCMEFGVELLECGFYVVGNVFFFSDLEECNYC